MTHLSESELHTALEEAAQHVHIGKHYRHYKHPEVLYTVTDLAILEATDEVCVIYVSDRGIPFVRSVVSWLEMATLEGHLVNRFQEVTD